MEYFANLNFKNHFKQRNRELCEKLSNPNLLSRKILIEIEMAKIKLN